MAWDEFKSGWKRAFAVVFRTYRAEIPKRINMCKAMALKFMAFMPLSPISGTGFGGFRRCHVLQKGVSGSWKFDSQLPSSWKREFSVKKSPFFFAGEHRGNGELLAETPTVHEVERKMGVLDWSPLFQVMGIQASDGPIDWIDSQIRVNQARIVWEFPNWACFCESHFVELERHPKRGFLLIDSRESPDRHCELRRDLSKSGPCLGLGESQPSDC